MSFSSQVKQDSYKEDTIITIPLLTIGNNLFKMNLSIGNPPQLLSNFFYDTQSFETMVAGWDCFNCRAGRFNHENSSTVNLTQIPDTIYNQAKEINLIGLYYSDQFQFDSSNQTNNTFFLKIERFSPDYTVIDYDGILGLGLKYDKTLYKEKINVLNMIMKANSINKRIFVQELGPNEGKLYIGGIPQAISNQANNNFSSCTVPNDLNSWACDISSVIPKNSFDVDQGLNYQNDPMLALFSTLEPYIKAPYKSIEFFRKEYFNNSSNCEVIELSSEIYVFKCKNEEKITKDINIVINSAAYQIQSFDLFTQKEDYKVFNIHFSKETNNWVFGQIFLKNYQVVFNGENNSIGFYGGFRYFFIPSKFWIWFTVISSILGFIAFVSLICWIRSYRKRKSETDYVLERNESIKL